MTEEGWDLYDNFPLDIKRFLQHSDCGGEDIMWWIELKLKDEKWPTHKIMQHLCNLSESRALIRGSFPVSALVAAQHATSATGMRSTVAASTVSRTR